MKVLAKSSEGTSDAGVGGRFGTVPGAMPVELQVLAMRGGEAGSVQVGGKSGAVPGV